MHFYQKLICALVFIIPLYPLQLDTRIIFVIALFALSLYKIFIKNFAEDLQAKNPVTIFFLLFLLASSISTIFSIDRERSLFTLLLYFSCFVIFTSIHSIFPTQKSKILLVTCYLLPVTILSLIALYNTLIIHYVNRTPEGASFMWSYFGHNHLSALLIFAIPLSIYLWKKSKFTILYSIFLLISLFFTFGLTSIGSLALSSVITLFLFLRVKTIKKIIVGIIVSLLLFISLTGAVSLNRNFGLTKNPEGSFKARIVYLQNALDNFKKRPLLGTGPDTFRIVNQKSDRKTFPSSYVHNFFIQRLTDTGILGFITSVGLIGSVLWQGFKKIHRKQNTTYYILHTAIFVGLLASTFNSLIDMDWQIPYVFFLFWLLAGLAQGNTIAKVK